MAVAHCDVGITSIARGEVLERGVTGTVEVEADVTRTIGVANVVRTAGAKFCTETEVMASDHVGRVVRELHRLVGSGVQGPRAIAANCMTLESGNPDFGNAEVHRLCNPGVNPKRSWIEIMIRNHDLLGKTVGTLHGIGW